MPFLVQPSQGFLLRLHLLELGIYIYTYFFFLILIYYLYDLKSWAHEHKNAKFLCRHANTKSLESLNNSNNE